MIFQNFFSKCQKYPFLGPEIHWSYHEIIKIVFFDQSKSYVTFIGKINWRNLKKRIQSTFFWDTLYVKYQSPDNGQKYLCSCWKAEIISTRGVQLLPTNIDPHQPALQWVKCGFTISLGCLIVRNLGKVLDSYVDLDIKDLKTIYLSSLSYQ